MYKSLLLSVSILMLSWSDFTLAANSAVSESLLNPVAKRLAAARKAKLNILTPQSYARAAKAYEKARTKLERGKSLESINKDLSKASEALATAEENEKPARITLSSGMEARDDALQVDANQYDERAWTKAENLFRAAAVTLERGSIGRAENKTSDAVSAYRELELRAIKSSYLTEAANLIAKAKDNDVDDRAPKTLAKAERLLAAAEASLNSDRYDTDRPRSLAREAKYEAIHSSYIAGVVQKESDDRGTTVEDLIVEWEQPFRQIAGELDIVVDLSNGSAQPTNDITQAISNLKAELRDLGLQLDENNQQLMLAQGQAKEKVALEAKLQRLNETKARFARIEKTFSPIEAQVLRQGDDVIIRLLGLSFDSGKSVINAGAFSLLRKVQEAIQEFPDSDIIVEGHTDSFGADEFNQKLSQQRAESVRFYVVTNMAVDPTAITATGFGESKPIATNESNEGRAKNRRIDLVIKPSRR